MGADRGPRLTRQRRAILDELKKLKTHPSAEELYRRLRRRMPNISLGTVYRNLELLTGQGKALRLEVGERKRRYDGDVTDHYHIVCIRCKRVDDIAPHLVAEMDKGLRTASDYEIIGHQLTFYGVCPECKSKV